MNQGLPEWVSTSKHQFQANDAAQGIPDRVLTRRIPPFRRFHATA